MLEMPDGTVYTQSSAVLKAVGRMKNGCLMPSSDDELALYLTDKLLSDSEDLRSESYKCFRSWGATDEAYKLYVDKVLPLHLGNFERMLIERGGDYFVVKDRLTVADVSVYDAVVNYGVNRVPEGCLDNFVELKKWVERVEGDKGISAYLSGEQFCKIAMKFDRTM